MRRIPETRQRKSHAEGREHSRRSISATGDARAGTCAGEALLPGHLCSVDLRPASSLGARCLRAGGRTPGPRCRARRDGARGAAGLGSRPGRRGRGGRTRADGMGCDERRAVHCGNPGAAATGSSSLGSGAGRRGRARGVRAGSEGAGGPASAERGEKKARAAQRAQTEHLAAAEPPVSAARSPRRAPGPGYPVRSRSSGRGCLGAARPLAHRVPPVRLEPPGPRRGLPGPCRGRAGFPLVLFRKQTRKPTPHHRVLLPARGRFCAEETVGPLSQRPSPGLAGRRLGLRRGRPCGAGWPAGAWAPRAGGARSWTR